MRKFIRERHALTVNGPSCTITATQAASCLAANGREPVSRMFVVFEAGDISDDALSKHYAPYEEPAVRFAEPVSIPPESLDDLDLCAFLRCDAGRWCYDAAFGFGGSLTLVTHQPTESSASLSSPGLTLHRSVNVGDRFLIQDLPPRSSR